MRYTLFVCTIVTTSIVTIVYFVLGSKVETQRTFIVLTNNGVHLLKKKRSCDIIYSSLMQVDGNIARAYKYIHILYIVHSFIQYSTTISLP